LLAHLAFLSGFPEEESESVFLIISALEKNKHLIFTIRNLFGEVKAHLSGLTFKFQESDLFSLENGTKIKKIIIQIAMTKWFQAALGVKSMFSTLKQ